VGPATGVSVFGQFVDHGAFEVAPGIDAHLNGDEMFDLFDFIDLLESLQP